MNSTDICEVKIKEMCDVFYDLYRLVVFIYCIGFANGGEKRLTNEDIFKINNLINHFKDLKKI